MWELTKSFRFEAAHALAGTTLAGAGEEIHGHSYRAEVAIRGTPDATTGMIVDLGLLERHLADIRAALDHKLLNKINALGSPTLEHLARFIFDELAGTLEVTRVTVHRDSCGESCTYRRTDDRGQKSDI